MAYDYDVDILAALWTGAEDAEEPYASFIAANPALTNETSEQRILSTIELLRSHMELLASRDEANLLHFAISRLIRHTAGGSNPFSEEAAVTEAVGNVNNPNFPAGATLDIDIDGVVTSPVSATGGDCQTVVSELNVALDMGGAGVAERTDLDIGVLLAEDLSGKYMTLNSAGDVTNYYVWWNAAAGIPEQTDVTTGVADVEGSLGGKYFTLNSSGDATSYYVWMSNTGRAEFTNITAAADTAGSLGGKYFTINSAGDATNYYVWLDHAATAGFADATNGSIVGATASAIGAATYDFDVTIDGGGLQALSVVLTGGETYSAIAGLMSAAVAGGTVAYDDPAFAFRVTSGTTGAGSAATVAAGTAGSGGGDLFAALDAADTVTHTFPAPTAGIAAPTDPAPGGLTAITATIAVNDTAADVGAALRLAITGNVDFSTEGGGATCDVTHAAVGAATDAADVDTGFAISVGLQGVDAAVDPAPGGTGIPVPYALNAGGLTLAGNVATAVGGNADFSAFDAGGTAFITAVGTGAVTTDAADVDTGFTVTVSRQGQAPSVDPAPGGLTGIPISVAAGESSGEIGANTRSFIGANPDFSTEGGGTDVEITNAAVGVTTDAMDVDSTVSVTTVTQGVDAGGDVVPVTAVCVQPGNRIAIRSQEDFLTFSLSNGGGGIIGPGGVIPGERQSTPKRVAEQGRDAAITLFVGKQRKTGGL